MSSLSPGKTPKNRASPVYLFASMKMSFVDIPTPPVFAMMELMSDDLCVAKEEPTPPPPPTPALFPDALTEGPLISESFRYIKVFKQRSSYDTVVTTAHTQELFFDEYLTVEYKTPNDKCMHTKLWDNIKNSVKVSCACVHSNAHEKECVRLPLMPYQRFMKRQSFC
jgi:hypothetical protein